MQNTHSNLRICPAHLEYARELDRTHGRAIAKNYLRQVLSPDYMSAHRLGAVRHSEKSLEKSVFAQEIPRPPEGWRVAMRQHIEKIGGEILAQFPDIEPKVLGKQIAKTYSYGSKTNHPYRVWQKELRHYLKQVELKYLG